MVFAVAVGEHGEAEEAEPVVDGFVEGGEDAGFVGVTGAALEHFLGFFAAIATEEAVEEVDHGPEVAAFFDVDLEEVAEVVEGGAGLTEEALLFDGGGFGVALGDDEAAEGIAVFAGDLVPDGLAFVLSEADEGVFFGGGEEDAPAVFGHADVVEVGPAAFFNADGGAEVDLVLLEAFGAHFHPPGEEVGLPLFEGALESAVVGEVDVVGDEFAVVDFACDALAHGGWSFLGVLGRLREISDAAEVEFGAFRLAETLERAVFTDGVGALEDPVLPRREPAKDFSFDGFGASKAQACFHACERVGRKRGAFLNQDADFVFPIDVVEGCGDESLAGGVFDFDRHGDRC